MTPAEQELYQAIVANARDGVAENLSKISMQTGLDYDFAKKCQKRLEAKQHTHSVREGAGRNCAMKIFVLGQQDKSAKVNEDEQSFC